MRSLIAVALFAAVAALVAVSQPSTGIAQDKKAKQPKADPKTFRPDAATLKTIKDRAEELRKAVAALKAKKIPDDVLIEVEIYLKAAENIVRFEEWLHANSVKWCLTTLDEGMKRAKQAEGGKAVWRDAPGKWVLRAYRSRIDDSIQPYSVLLPHDYGKDPKKKWRLDVVLHGRDGSLTEAKFIATHQGTAPKDLGHVQLEVYGRGNNAYRWAGEADVFEAIGASLSPHHRDDNIENGKPQPIDMDRLVLRGFSMGGAGTWHIGLHRPCLFSVIGPGAGFTTTHGYIANLPKELPEYQEKCLRIYDAVRYAENAFNVPIVAYSGEKDKQKAAADHIENALKNFKEPVKFTHLVAPGLEHKMPPEWQAKAQAEYGNFADKGRDRSPKRIRFVTYTPRYGRCDWVKVWALEEMYSKAVIDVKIDGTAADVKTTNVRRFDFNSGLQGSPGFTTITVDGQVFKNVRRGADSFEKRDGKWALLDANADLPPGHKAAKEPPGKKYPPDKHGNRAGPIDDAFIERFEVVKLTGPGFHAGIDQHAAAAVEQFAGLWDRYFRGTLPVIAGEKYDPEHGASVVLFGDPQSNPLIAKVLPKLPITWTKEKLVVNGVEYDPKTHVPVLIYPNPLNRGYVVINSGHTFKEADLKGTNALLYPRLGDWAVIKPTPTEKDPAAYEVVAAGLFDENWQFPKKK